MRFSCSSQVGRETWASPYRGDSPLQKPQTRTARAYGSGSKPPDRPQVPSFSLFLPFKVLSLALVAAFAPVPALRLGLVTLVAAMAPGSTFPMAHAAALLRVVTRTQAITVLSTCLTGCLASSDLVQEIYHTTARGLHEPPLLFRPSSS